MNFTRNAEGVWVPSIPLPLVGLRKRCHCGSTFWRMAFYRRHYALDHIVDPKPGRR
jgi:hypothetical protein